MLASWSTVCLLVVTHGRRRLLLWVCRPASGCAAREPLPVRRGHPAGQAHLLLPTGNTTTTTTAAATRCAAAEDTTAEIRLCESMCRWLLNLAALPVRVCCLVYLCVAPRRRSPQGERRCRARPERRTRVALLLREAGLGQQPGQRLQGQGAGALAGLAAVPAAPARPAAAADLPRAMAQGAAGSHTHRRTAQLE